MMDERWRQARDGDSVDDVVAAGGQWAAPDVPYIRQATQRLRSRRTISRRD